MHFFNILPFASIALATPFSPLSGLDTLFKRQSCPTSGNTPKSDDLGPVTVSNLAVEGTREQFTISFNLLNENTQIDTSCSATLSIGSTDKWIDCQAASTGAIAKFKYSTDDDDWNNPTTQSVTIDIYWQFVKGCAICPDPNTTYFSYGNVNQDIPCTSASKKKRGSLNARQSSGAVSCKAESSIPVSVTNVCEGDQAPQQ